VVTGGDALLLVKPAGSKLWRWKYHLQGKENRCAIGGFPQANLTEACIVREKVRSGHAYTQPINGSRLSRAI
jgi:hypothetical protein